MHFLTIHSILLKKMFKIQLVLVALVIALAFAIADDVSNSPLYLG